MACIGNLPKMFDLLDGSDNLSSYNWRQHHGPTSDRSNFNGLYDIQKNGSDYLPTLLGMQHAAETSVPFFILNMLLRLTLVISFRNCLTLIDIGSIHCMMGGLLTLDT